MVSEVSRSLAGSDCMEGRPATWAVHGGIWSCMVLLHGSFGAACITCSVCLLLFSGVTCFRGNPLCVGKFLCSGGTPPPDPVTMGSRHYGLPQH